MQERIAAPQAFHTSLLTRGQSVLILSSAAVMLSIAMGLRQSLGLFQTPVVQDLGLKAADFAMAIAIQNIIWGFTQPFAGALVDRFGPRRIAIFGALLYALGLAITAQRHQCGDDHARHRRAGRRRAVVHHQRDRRQRRGPRDRARAAQPGLRHRLRGRLDRHLLRRPARAGGDAGGRLAPGARRVLRREPVHAADGLPRRPGRTAAQLQRRRQGPDAGRRARRGPAPQRLRGHEPGLLRVRAAAGVPHHAPAELPGAVRHGPHARRPGAGDDRPLQHHRIVGLRLAGRPLFQAGAARVHLHHPLAGDGGLLPAAGVAQSPRCCSRR